MLNLREQSPAQIVVFNSTGQVWHSTEESTMSRRRSLSRVGLQTLKEVVKKLYAILLLLTWCPPSGMNEGEGAGKESPMQSTSFQDEMELGGESTELKSELNSGRKKTVSCTKCGISLLNASLNRHIKRFHPQEKSSEKVVEGDGQGAPSEKWEVSPRLRVGKLFPPPEEGKVRCDECGKNFTSKKSLAFHTKIIHRGERLQCEAHGCAETFGSSESRGSHMRKEHGSQMLRCKFEGCTSEFYSQNSRRRHHLNHQV